jgi:hypothetical protein
MAALASLQMVNTDNVKSGPLSGVRSRYSSLSYIQAPHYEIQQTDIWSHPPCNSYMKSYIMTGFRAFPFSSYNCHLLQEAAYSSI